MTISIQDIAKAVIVGTTGLTAFFITLAFSPLLALSLTSAALMIAVFTDKEMQDRV